MSIMSEYKTEVKELEQTFKKEKTENNDNKSSAQKYPKFVFLIIANEFCERFSYYGLRTVLYIYLTGFLKIEKDSATAIYHLFGTLCYFSPILGAIIADGYLGLYSTILYVSCFYCVGEVVLALTSIKPLGAPSLTGTLVGLLIISLGTGGIKPCVSAFGGNQFHSDQQKYIRTFFSMFYISINIGSTLGTIFTPIFRNDVKCFGDDCYPLAFGVPALLMLISIVVFVIGTPFYKRENEKSKDGKNIIKDTAICTFIALKNKFNGNSSAKKDHWLDYADTKYSKDMIDDVKAFFKVLFVFLPLPIFWALYDQQGSRWTLQAQQLDGRIGSFTIKPDQFQAVNPILIVALVPLFDIFVYPFFAKFNLFKNLLQRMSGGLVLAIISFIIAAVLELKMQNSWALINPSNQVKIINQSPCNIDVYRDSNLIFNINPYEDLHKFVIEAEHQNSSFTYKSQCLENNFSEELWYSSNGQVVLPINVIFNYNYLKNTLERIHYSYSILNEPIGFSEVRFLLLDKEKSSKIINLKLHNSFIEYDNIPLEVLNNDKDLESGYATIDYGSFKISINGSEKNSDFILEAGGRYDILLYGNNSKLDFKLITNIYPNGIHLLWQLIQILIMSFGEIMFSISGLSFAYSEAPVSMKSTMQSLWFITVAFGNLIVVFISEFRFISDQVYEYIFYAFLLSLATVWFIIVGYYYEYKEKKENSNEF